MSAQFKPNRPFSDLENFVTTIKILPKPDVGSDGEVSSWALSRKSGLVELSGDYRALQYSLQCLEKGIKFMKNCLVSGHNGWYNWIDNKYRWTNTPIDILTIRHSSNGGKVSNIKDIKERYTQLLPYTSLAIDVNLDIIESLDEVIKEARAKGLWVIGSIIRPDKKLSIVEMNDAVNKALQYGLDLIKVSDRRDNKESLSEAVIWSLNTKIPNIVVPICNKDFGARVTCYNIGFPMLYTTDNACELTYEKACNVYVRTLLNK